MSSQQQYQRLKPGTKGGLKATGFKILGFICSLVLIVVAVGIVVLSVYWLKGEEYRELNTQANALLPKLEVDSERLKIVERLGQIEAKAVELGKNWKVGNGAHPQVVDALLRLLKNSRSEVPAARHPTEIFILEERRVHRKLLRIALTEALKKTHDPRAADELLETLTDADSSVVRAGGTALFELGDDRAIKPLIALFKQGKDVGACLVDFKQVSTLLEAMNDSNLWKQTRTQAAAALTSLSDDPNVAAALDAGIAAGRSEVLAGAYKYIMWKGNESDIPILIRVLNEDGDGEMAVYFLNSGQPELRTAADDWVRKKGYTKLFNLLPKGGKTVMDWGRKR